MIFNSKTIEKLISNTFETDCIDICLNQKIDNDPVVYTGPGTIYQDENGTLQLKAYSKITDLKKGLSRQIKYHTPGKIIAKDDYFILKATDMSGSEWIADNVWVTANISVPASGVIIRSSLREVETIEEGSSTKKDYLFIIVPGSSDIWKN